MAGLALWGILATASCCIVQSRAATIDDPMPSSGLPANVPVVEHPADSRPSGGTHMAADCVGAIEEVLIRIDGREPELFADAHAELVHALLPSSDVRILHDGGDSQEPVRRRIGALAPSQAGALHWHLTRQPGSAWLRDVVTAGHGPNGAVWILHTEQHYRLMAVRAGGADAQAILAAHQAAPQLTGLGIDGGEMVCDGERVLVSERAAERARRGGSARSDAGFLEQVEAAYGYPAVLVRNTGTDTWGHCDLVLAAAARRTLVVGNPALASRILRETPAEDLAAFEQRLVDAAAGARRLRPLPRRLRERGVLRRLVSSSTRASRLAAFSRMRSALRDDGFELVDVPFLSLDPRADGTRVVLSYTNVVLDAAPDRKRAFIPQYGLATLDRAALEAWRDLGWTPVGIECLGPALAGGGLRCLTQVVRREPVPSAR